MGWFKLSWSIFIKVISINQMHNTYIDYLIRI